MVGWHMAQYYHSEIPFVANSLGIVETARYISVPQGFSLMREKLLGIQKRTFG